MLKRKISKKRGFSLDDMPSLKANKNSKLQNYDPSLFFKDLDKVGTALLESLVENDTEAFIEILDAYLRVNKSRLAKKTKMSRSTIQHAFSKKGNPTLKTIARIVHESISK